MDKLIYGKDQTLNIVSLECKENVVELFIQNEDGSIRSETRPNKYWILSPISLGANWVRLKGDLHYKYGKQFDTRESWGKTKYSLTRNDIFSIADAKEASMINKGITYYKGLKPKDVSILSFDIESTSLEHNENARVLLISNTFRNNNVITKKLFSYDEFESEGEMIVAWAAWVREQDPSIICGHNIYGYDLPYLQYLADCAGVKMELGRDSSELHFNTYESKKRKDGSQDISYKKVRCYGRELVDTMFLAITYDVGRKYESYGLKKIVEHEGIRFEGRQMYDASQIRHNYTDPVEWEKIKKYCEHDSDEALAIYDLMVPSFFYMTQAVPKSFQSMIESATGSQINAVMLRSYLQEGHSLPKATEAEEFEGAISFGNPGIYRNVFKVDVASLYPSIMLQYEVFDKDKDPQANFLKLLQTFTTERLKNKKLAKDTKEQYYDDLQGAYKIFINSCYGFLGSKGLLFNSPKLAAFVTESGRKILEKAIDWAVSNKSYKVVNADTDSISYSKLDESAFTEEERNKDLEELNSLYPNRINFEDDGYYPTVIVLKAKNYILDDGKKVKYKGSALKSSKSEAALKEMQKAIIQVMLDGGDNFTEVYHRYIVEALEITDIKRWAGKKTYTSKLTTSDRPNETKVLDALAGSDYKEGDKFFTYFKEDESIGLIENFDGKYNREKMLDKCYKSVQIFENVLDCEKLFLNYKLKKNKAKLKELIYV